jgi:2-(1,2-epoxy-1,2-dihydrophenyl)acetyl-CoA isomerase
MMRSAEVGPSPVVTAISDAVATVTLNRPERLNAVTPEMFSRLRQVLDMVSRRTDVRVVVITGAGRAFCAGVDLVHRSTDDVTGEKLRADASLIETIHALPQITIAAINGACAGLGLALATACDLRLASSQAIFTTGYLTVGLPGDFGGLWTLSRTVGKSRAAQLYMLPDRFDAARANALGMLSDEPTDDLDLAVARLVARLVDSAPLALRAIKENLADVEALDLAMYLDRESRRHAAVRASDDAREAAQAFIDKRSPRFNGK